ncbi:alpha-galactosidase [Bryocella elongata]|uniref:Alpha-galactosidase n=1 Tax=Bryocella elongata TaxID=863522 RepID=A0A1H5S0G4_9BACT|nr:glycoside hydrolase family 27 protein [Bryocella elongata]SEF43398.1 alpha-galactosidase [Bryocella elongata]
MKKICALVLGLLGAMNPLFAQRSNVSATPPMGWNSWNHFAEKVTEADVRAAADALVSSGMRDAGYVYVNIDDTWEGKRDAQGVIHTNDKFPDMKGLADYVHSKGLKLGIYSSPGPSTCAGYEGSYGHEDEDARTYAAWGIDYLKYDQCSFGDIIEQQAGGDQDKAASIQRAAYEKMHQAIMKAGRPMVYSFCQYGLYAVWQWGPDAGANLWRTTGDISDHWDRMSLIGFDQDGLEKFAGPGHWNDPDMLEIGNGGMTRSEYEVHMSLWAMLSAPLLAGNDLSKMTPETKSILMNRDVIAVDQDPLGHQAKRLWVEGPMEIWGKDLSGGRRVIAYFNRGEAAFDFDPRLSILAPLHGVRFKDLWSGNTIVLNEKSRLLVPRHGVLLLRQQ